MLISRRIRTLVLFSACLCFPPMAIGGGNIVLVNDDGFSYDLRANTGELSDGSWTDGVDSLSDACDGCWELMVDGERYNPGDSPTFDASNREVTYPVQSMSGLDVVRRVYVPQAANFIRYLNVLTNPSGSDIIVELSYETNLGSDSQTLVVETSSGDTLADAEDFWVVTNGDPNDPVVSHLWDGRGGDRVDVVFLSAPGDDDVDWTWEEVTVPAGETVIYMSLGIMSVTAEDAVAAANVLFNLVPPVSVTLPEVVFNLDDTTLMQIQNWSFFDSDEDGLLDGYETFYGLNPDDGGDAASDNDMDGLTALEEFNQFSDPTNPDTDGDGLLDGAEVTLGTSPIRADTDRDGVSDPGELNSGLDPNDPNDFSITQVVSDGVNASTMPEVWEDSAGNLNVVYSADITQPDERGGGDRQIFYTLLNSAGDVLIAPTQISEFGVGNNYNNRGQVAATDAGVVYVTWQNSGPELYLKVLDVSVDDQDGSAADPAAIGPTPVRLLSPDDYNHSAVTVDSEGNAHILAQRRCSGLFRYYKVGPDGADIFPEVELANHNACHVTVSIALDSADNPHFAYSSSQDPAGNSLSAYQLFYGMLNGADGSTLIEPSLMTLDDGFRAKHTTISVDDSDIVHIVWGNGVEAPNGNGEARGGNSDLAELYYMSLDPSLAAQDGGGVTNDALTVTPMTLISPDDDVQSWYIESRLDDGQLNITWNDGGGFGASPAYYMTLDTADGSTSAPVLISDSVQRFRGNNYVPVAGGKAFVKLRVDGVLSVVAQQLFAGPVETATGSGIAEVKADGGVAVSLEALDIGDLPAEAQSGAPAAVDFPDGFFRIIVNGVAEGGTAEITLQLPTEYDAASDLLFKWNAVDGWTSYPYTLGDTTQEVVFTLTDGGAGDADGIANGQIVDPVGPAMDANANAPMFTSAPATSVTVGNAYNYNVAATDVETAGTLTYMGVTIPAWLAFVDNGDGTATLSGTPADGDVGANAVSLQADDGAFVPKQSLQNFTITVNAAVVAEPTVTTDIAGKGGGNGATTPWLLLLATGLLYARNRRSQKGAQ